MYTQKGVKEIGIEDLLQVGLNLNDATVIDSVLKDVILLVGLSDPRAVWREIVERRALKPNHPFRLHQLVYYSVYAHWDVDTMGPRLYWFPSLYQSQQSNLGRILETYGPRLLGGSYRDPLSSYKLFHKFSVENPDIYWGIVLQELSVVFQKPPGCILDTSDNSKHGGTWLPGSVYNIAECCILPSSCPIKYDNSVAVIWREEGDDESPVNRMTLAELRAQVMLVANLLDGFFSKGDAIAIVMPMTVYAVIIYLGIVLAGFVVVSIADSFAAKEIAARLRISHAKAIFTQDFIIRGGRKYPLYSRVVDAAPDKVFVLPANGSELAIQLREQDLSWKDFLSTGSHLARPHEYTPFYQQADAITNILFSSGTSGQETESAAIVDDFI